MNTARKIFPVALLVILILSACAPATASFVPLPDAERTGITTLIVAVVGLIFSAIGKRLPWSAPFLSKYQLEISLALAGTAIGFIENLLPGAYPEVSVLLVQLILAIFAASGLIKLLAKAGVPGIQGKQG